MTTVSPLVTIQLDDETRQALEALYDWKESTTPADGARICREAIAQVPTNYTAWQRYAAVRQTLGERDVEGDQMVEQLVYEMPKNYQLWNFRRQIFMQGESSIDHELFYAEAALEDDNKNYHAWSHRQAVLRQSEQRSAHWQAEMRFVEKMLQLDVFNNSAWTQLWFLLQHDPTLRVYDNVMGHLRRAPHCAAGWRFLDALLANSKDREVRDAVTFGLEILETSPRCLPCLEFLADQYFRHSEIGSARRLWRQCLLIDPIRSPYWTSRLGGPDPSALADSAPL